MDAIFFYLLVNGKYIQSELRFSFHLNTYHFEPMPLFSSSIQRMATKGERTKQSKKTRNI